MKGTVVYDSIHGNTKQIAEGIAEQLRSDGVDVELFSVRERKTPSGDFLFLGSPTRGSRPTKPSVQFLEGLDVSYWSSHPVVLFDKPTLSKDIVGKVRNITYTDERLRYDIKGYEERTKAL